MSRLVRGISGFVEFEKPDEVANELVDLVDLPAEPKTPCFGCYNLGIIMAMLWYRLGVDGICKVSLWLLLQPAAMADRQATTAIMSLDNKPLSCMGAAHRTVRVSRGEQPGWMCNPRIPTAHQRSQFPWFRNGLSSATMRIHALPWRN